MSLLPALWKANEESWAEGSFCVLVKKNNLCQRRVLQQLCCRTCSQKGWRDADTGRKGSPRWDVGHTGGTPPSQSLCPRIHSHIIYKRICASLQGLHRRCDDRTTTNLPFFCTGTHVVRMQKRLGLASRRNENKTNKKNKSVGILWPKHRCQNNWAFFFSCQCTRHS